jgi:hypothetical protein
MLAVGEEAREPRLGLRDGVRPGDAESVEAVLARCRRQGGLERRRVAQKSRSA